MTALLAFLRVAYPWLIGAALGGYGAHELDQIPYGRLQTTLASERTQHADEVAAGQKAAADALQAQIKTRLTIEANNGNVIAQLTAERDSAAADRDLAQRLLNAASHPAAPSHPVSTAAGRPIADDAPKGGGDQQAPDLVGTLSGAIAECRDALQRFAGLQLELAPQLKVTHDQ